MWRARSQSPTDLTLRGAAWRTQPPGRWLSASPRRSSSAGRSTPTSFVGSLHADAGAYHGWAHSMLRTLVTWRRLIDYPAHRQRHERAFDDASGNHENRPMSIYVELREASGRTLTGLAEPSGGTFDAAVDFDRF